MRPPDARAKRGRFVTLEGGEGGGKSTQIRRLAAHLEARGVSCVVTREPGGSPGAEAIRALLVSGDRSFDGITELLLVLAARRDHVETTIQPALDAGSWVLCDRFADSTRAYQGGGRGVSMAVIDALGRAAIGDLTPDLTFILDLPVDLGLRRAADRPGGELRFERLGWEFHTRVRAAFQEIARTESARCRLVDATLPVDAVTRVLIADADALLMRG